MFNYLVTLLKILYLSIRAEWPKQYSQFHWPICVSPEAQSCYFLEYDLMTSSITTFLSFETDRNLETITLLWTIITTIYSRCSACQACSGTARGRTWSPWTGWPAPRMCVVVQAGEQDGPAAEPGPCQLHHEHGLHRIQLRRSLPGKTQALCCDNLHCYFR